MLGFIGGPVVGDADELEAMWSPQQGVPPLQAIEAVAELDAGDGALGEQVERVVEGVAGAGASGGRLLLHRVVLAPDLDVDEVSAGEDVSTQGVELVRGERGAVERRQGLGIRR